MKWLFCYFYSTSNKSCFQSCVRLLHNKHIKFQEQSNQKFGCKNLSVYCMLFRLVFWPKQYLNTWFSSVIGKCTLLQKNHWEIYSCLMTDFNTIFSICCMYNHNLLWKQSSKKRTFKSTILLSRIKIDLFSFLMEGKRKQSDAFSAKRKFLPFHKKLHSFIKFKKNSSTTT